MVNRSDWKAYIMVAYRGVVGADKNSWVDILLMRHGKMGGRNTLHVAWHVEEKRLADNVDTAYITKECPELLDLVFDVINARGMA